MIEWDWAPKALWVDLDANSIYLGGEEMFNIEVANGELNINYSEGWNEYFTNDAEWNALIKNNQEKLKKGELKKGEAKKGTKGKGKIGHRK